MRTLSFGIFFALLGSTASAATIESFSFTGVIESWAAPQTGDYRITAIGAQGASADPGYEGGRGAQIEGSFTFNEGDVFQILVGGAGTNDSINGGGGGGTFFVSFLDAPLLIAGGGGGTRTLVSQNGTDASITQAAYTASGSGPTYSPTLKTTDIGQGGIVSARSWGSAGGGFYSAGGSDSICGSRAVGGGDWASGMFGGSNDGVTTGPGGFGGGGSGDGCAGGGGGGGYSGGDGGRIAGGGGSYNSGLDQFALTGVGYGNGSLTIEYEAFAAIPIPATLPLLLTGLGGLALMRGRSRKPLS